MNQINIISEIQSFLEGKNTDLKYLVNVETDSRDRFATCIIHDPVKGKLTEKIEFYPFLYIKDLKKEGYRLFNGNEMKRNAIIKKYGITIKKLKTANHPRLENGYPYIVKTTGAFENIINFFKEAGLDPYDKMRDENDRIIYGNNGIPISKHRHLFYIPKLKEQFFISTGIRLFKGFEDYNDIHKLTFDIETTGLRYEHSRIFAIGIKDNRGFEYVIEGKSDDLDKSEKRIIQDFFKIIDILRPAVISGYNSENFDFEFILKRAELLRVDLSKMITTLHNEKEITRVDSTVKFGGNTERYKKTNAYGYTILDIIHAVKKTAAVNSEIKNNKLKYICQFENIAKPNRMYIDGDEIGRFWNQNPIFLLNKVNNNYVEIPSDYNKIGIELYSLQEKKENISDDEYNENKKSILGGNDEFIKWLSKKFKELFKEVGDPKKDFRFECGKNILRRYLLDDLWETEQVDNLYNQSSFLLAKIVPTDYGRVATMGNAAVWNLLMTAWSYDNDLAIPHPDDIEHFSGGLARCFKKGYVKKLLKIDYASLYPMIQLTHDVFPTFDITGVIKKMLSYMTTTRNIYKKLANSSTLKDSEIELLKNIDNESYEKYIKNTFTDGERNIYKVKQLPIKILNNSLFGALGSGFAFNWSDNICAARITSSGRLYLRKAIHFFKEFGLEPLMAVTDGVNFGIPETTTIRITNEGVIEGVNEGVIDEMWEFNGKNGVSALIEYFNESLKDDYNNESVTYDTPIYINSDGKIDIIPICELFDENSESLDVSKERDYSKKNFKVLTKTGWNDIKYVFKHKTNKKIHRVTTKDRLINVTEDHSLFQKGVEIKPRNLMNGDILDVIDIPINNNYSELSIEKAWLYGFFFGDGSSINKRRNKIVDNEIRKNGIRRSWKISNTNKKFLETCINILKTEFDINVNIIDRSKSQKKSNNVKPLYEIVSFNKELCEEFSKIFYTSYRDKKIPINILNATEDIKRAFIYGALDSDGYYLGLFDIDSFGQKTQVGMAGFSYLLKSIGVDYTISLRKDKSNFITFRFDREFNEKYKNILSLKTKTNHVHNNYIYESKNEFVYDISTTDETFVGGIGGILCHNTSKGRENCFLSVDNDGEFESCLNLARINYALKTPKKIKFIGNTIKSKTMSEYIEEFVDKAIGYILDGDGVKFLEYYYDYVDKIYYHQIPLKKIASKSRIKNSISDYISRGTDKNGKLKSKQAHMELLIEEREKIARDIFENDFDKFKDDDERKPDEYDIIDIMERVESHMPPEPEIGTTLYHVNIGTRKSHGEVKTDPKTGETIIRSKLISNKDLEENPNMLGEYNVDKYLDAFNTRVKTLLDGFEKKVRENIIVKIERKKVKDASGQKFDQVILKKNEFTPSELELKSFDHDTYEDSMYLENKEVEFWNRTGYDPKKIWDGFKTKNDDDHGLLYSDIYQQALNYVGNILEKSGKGRLKSVNDDLNKGEFILIKNYVKLKNKENIDNQYVYKIGKYRYRNKYTLGFYNGEYIRIVKDDVVIPISDIEKKWVEEEILKEKELEKKRIIDELMIKKKREELEKKSESVD